MVSDLSNPQKHIGFDLPVSVIMPAYNAAATLPRAVASVQSQDMQDWELLIVDDGSQDETARIATALGQEDSRIHCLVQPRNSGVAMARNRAIDAARGRYLAFLDADDTWSPEKLSRQLAFMRARDAALSYTGFWRQRGDQRHRVQVPVSVDRATLLRGNVIGCLTAVYDRAKLGSVPFPALPLRQDYALWLEILAKTDRAHGLDEPLATYHCQPGSLSAGRLRASCSTWRMYRQYFGFSRRQAAVYLSSHLLGRLRRG